MRILSIIQPSEMGPDFRFEDDVWKVNFPAGSGEGGGVPLSTDANNAIGLGTDQGAFISTDLLGAYALTQDNGSKKINLYRFPAGTEFDPETATLVSSVNLIELSGIFDDVAIDGDVITFTDADTGLTLSIDTANLQKVSDIVGSDAINVISIDGVTTIEVRIDPDPNNLIQLSEGGLFVNPNDLGGGDFDLHQTLAPVENGLCHVVGSSHLVVPQIELVDVAGNSIGYINDLIGLPVSSTTEDDDHCPKWEAPTASNCRIGKIAVGLVDDLPYELGDEGPGINWRIFIDGVDTGYIATSGGPIGEPMPSLMALGQEDYNENDVMGSGYLEGIISQASNGTVGGDYDGGLSLWNETNSQVIITLVPSMRITIEDMNNAYNGNGIKIYGMNAEQLSVIKDNLPKSEAFEPPSVENLEDYFDEENGGVITICLAPNASGGGGTTGPQISCDGATDRFATSALWGDQYILKINGSQVVTNGRYDDVMQTMRDRGIRTEFNGEMETTYRNTTDENIRIDLEVISTSGWNFQGIELDLSTNPTLMGHDPIEEMASFAFNDGMGGDEPKLYRRLTVCLAPTDTYMGWDYKELDTSTAVVTLTNSFNLIEANQEFSVGEEIGVNLDVDTNTDKWGDLIWTIYSDQPVRADVTLIIEHPNYSDEYTCDFFARKPMVVTLANTNEYAKTVNVASYIAGNTIDIVSVEVATANGFTTVTELDDGLVIDLKVGSLRIDNLAEGMFSYILQGRFVGIELIETVKVKFVTETGAEEIAEVELNADNFEGEFLVISESTYKKVIIGVVDPNHYTNLNDRPAINLEIPEWASRVMKRINGVGAEDTYEINFNDPGDTHQLYIKAYLNGAQLAVLGDCVIGVDDWGETDGGGFTFNHETYNSRFDENMEFINISKNNLSYVPAEEPSNLQSMTGMFAGTDLSDPSVNLSAYYVENVSSFAGVFAYSNFNGNIVAWGTRWARNMNFAFYGSKFRQDLSLWCVSNIGSEPLLFSHRAPLQGIHKPVWGTCPLKGNNTSSEWGEFSLRGVVESHGIRGYGLDDDFIAKIHPEFTNAGKLVEAIAYSPMRYLGKRSLKDQEINKLTLKEGLFLIDDQALMNNQLTSVTIPSTVKTIGVEAFAGNPMTSINLLGITPPNLGLDALPQTVTDVVAFDEAFAAYAKHKDWKQHVGKLKPMSQANGVVYVDKKGKKGFLAGPVIADYALVNSQVFIESINDGVTKLGNDALLGNYAYALKIPNSLTTVAGPALNLQAQILEFEEGRENTAFMADTRPEANVVILPSTMTELSTWVVAYVPRVIVSKAVVPPTMLVWDTYTWNGGISEYRSSLGMWYTNSGTGCEALYVPTESIEAYRADPHWKMYTTNILPLDEFDYGNVKTIKMTASGSNYQISGTTDLASVGEEVIVRYYESLYNSNTGRNVPTNIIIYTAVVEANGVFMINVPIRDTLANHYVDAVIGAGNILVTNSLA